MTINPWPAALRLLECRAELRNFAKSGGVTGTGRQQRVFSDAGYWEITVRLLVRNRDHANAYKAMIARLRTGEDILVKVQDLARPMGAAEPFGTVQFGSAVALRATTATINTNGVVLQAGNHFSVAGQLYRITEIVSGPATPPTLSPWQSFAPWRQQTPWENGEDPTGSYEVKFLPPARQAFASGANLITKAMTLKCVMKDLAEGDMELAVARLGEPTITFIEQY